MVFLLVAMYAKEKCILIQHYLNFYEVGRLRLPLICPYEKGLNISTFMYTLLMHCVFRYLKASC